MKYINKILKRITKADTNSAEENKDFQNQNKEVSDSSLFYDAEDGTLFRQGSPVCFEDMPLEINWKITEACNYRCSYCFDAKGEYEENFCTLEQVETAISHLASSNRPSYHITLTGGEPTSHPYLAEIITLLGRHLGERIEKITIITNGSFNKRVTDAITELASISDVGIAVSIHVEFARIDKLVALVEQLSSKVSLDFALMLHPTLFDKVQGIFDTLCELRKRHGFYMHISLLREAPSFTKDDSRYTEEHYSWRKKAIERFKAASEESRVEPVVLPKNRGYEFKVDRIFNKHILSESPLDLETLRDLTKFEFQGMMCCFGAHIIHIQPDGTVRGAVCGHGPKRCNIYEENPFDTEDWIYAFKCKKSRCGCNVDYRIPKFLDSDEAQEFISRCRQKQADLIKD